MKKGNFKKYMTENGPEEIEKNFYIKGEEEPTLQYVIKHKGELFLFWVPLEVSEDGQVKVLDKRGYSTQIFNLTTKDKKSTKGTSYNTVANLGYLNYQLKKGIMNGHSSNSYDLRPVIDYFFKIAPKDIKEYNTNVVFGSEKETQDIFGDIYTEL